MDPHSFSVSSWPVPGSPIWASGPGPLNLAGAIAVGLLVYRFSPDSLSMASTTVAAASGSLVMTAAKTMNAKFTAPAASPSSR
ncbi:MAG TPA: hypothetical protein VKB40_14220 [Candidatus Acidoferrales bacterium]|nr:hypothetical protein [Candidatus Acidoferrales bacterium]